MFSPRLTVIADMTPDIKNNQDDHEHDDYSIQAIEDGFQSVQVISQNYAEVGKQQGPGQRAKERIEAEFAKGHFGNASRKRNVGTHDWKQAREESCCAAPFLKKLISFIRIMLRDQDVASIFQHQWATTCISDTIGCNRSYHATNRAGQSDQDQV